MKRKKSIHGPAFMNDIHTFSSLKKQKSIKVTCFLFLIFLLSSMPGCGPKGTPQEQIRLFIAAGEEAAEKRDWGGIRKLISDNYGDEQRRSKQDLVRVAAGYFLRHDNIHLLTRIEKLTLLQEDEADVIVLVAMADLPVKTVDTLLDLQADLYRFEMKLKREDNDWLLIKAHWRQAEKQDFLPKF